MSEKQGSIYILSGPSGSGKNTVYDALSLKCDDLAHTVSVTTRAPRSGEKDGIDYYFVTTDTFFEKIENGDFVEYVKYGSNYYGTLKSEINRLVKLGKKVLLVIEVNGAFNVKKVFPQAKTIFIIPPSIEELRRRINSRGQNNEEDTNARLTIAVEEMKQKDKYDYIVVNDILENCVNDIYNILNN